MTYRDLTYPHGIWYKNFVSQTFVQLQLKADPSRMLLFHIVVVMPILFTVVDGQISFITGEDMVNLTILENDMDDKSWTIYIDELLYLYNTSNLKNMGAILHQMHHLAKLADYWCNIPESYIGLYERNLEARVRTKHFNVSDFLPCGAIVSQYFVADSFLKRRVIDLLVFVPKMFHINISILELHIATSHVHPTQVQMESEGICHIFTYLKIYMCTCTYKLVCYY